MIDASKERVHVDRAKAEAMMPPGDQVHTLMQAGGNVFVGADRDRESILIYADAGKLELAGPVASGMRHGLVFESAAGWVFVATKPQ